MNKTITVKRNINLCTPSAPCAASPALSLAGFGTTGVDALGFAMDIIAKYNILSGGYPPSLLVFLENAERDLAFTDEIRERIREIYEILETIRNMDSKADTPQIGITVNNYSALKLKLELKLSEIKNADPKAYNKIKALCEGASDIGAFPVSPKARVRLPKKIYPQSNNFPIKSLVAAMTLKESRRIPSSLESFYRSSAKAVILNCFRSELNPDDYKNISRSLSMLSSTPDIVEILSHTKKSELDTDERVRLRKYAVASLKRSLADCLSGNNIKALNTLLRENGGSLSDGEKSLLSAASVIGSRGFNEIKPQALQILGSEMLSALNSHPSASPSIPIDGVNAVADYVFSTSPDNLERIIERFTENYSETALSSLSSFLSFFTGSADIRPTDGIEKREQFRILHEALNDSSIIYLVSSLTQAGNLEAVLAGGDRSEKLAALSLLKMSGENVAKRSRLPDSSLEAFNRAISDDLVLLHSGELSAGNPLRLKSEGMFDGLKSKQKLLNEFAKQSESFINQLLVLSDVSSFAGGSMKKSGFLEAFGSGRGKVFAEVETSVKQLAADGVLDDVSVYRRKLYQKQITEASRHDVSEYIENKLLSSAITGNLTNYITNDTDITLTYLEKLCTLPGGIEQLSELIDGISHLSAVKSPILSAAGANKDSLSFPDAVFASAKPAPSEDDIAKTLSGVDGESGQLILEVISKTSGSVLTNSVISRLVHLVGAAEEKQRPNIVSELKSIYENAVKINLALPSESAPRQALPVRLAVGSEDAYPRAEQTVVIKHSVKSAARKISSAHSDEFGKMIISGVPEVVSSPAENKIVFRSGAASSDERVPEISAQEQFGNLISYNPSSPAPQSTRIGGDVEGFGQMLESERREIDRRLELQNETISKLKEHQETLISELEQKTAADYITSVVMKQLKSKLRLDSMRHGAKRS